ncbi:hypothetical protein ABID97_005259 [Variovorax sp. OAS795]|uniref:hypothetical protein n=1 Tax=Variovorax sp. OAS795 TaxID=3034231 RepID=UPI0033960787
MKSIAYVSIIGAVFLGSSLSCLAQTKPQAAQVRAERKAEATQTAREFKPGEGDPIPEARPKVSRPERVKAREARKTTGGEAARAFMPGEGNPKPSAIARLPRAERRAERSAKRAELKAENKVGAIPSYGDSYGSSQRK